MALNARGRKAISLISPLTKVMGTLEHLQLQLNADVYVLMHISPRLYHIPAHLCVLSYIKSTYTDT